MRGYSPNYGHYVAFARPPGRIHCAVPSDKHRQVALRRPVAAWNQARRLPSYRTQGWRPRADHRAGTAGAGATIGLLIQMGNWRSRRRDPAVTGIVPLLPWRAEDPCPCGADRLYGNCCGLLSQSPYKQIVEFRPPGATTGYSHPKCYMGWTRDCSQMISREHFISKTVLSILNPESVRISGATWIPTGQSLDLPLTGLQANILCTRHNSALSPLDTTAGKLFRAVDGIYDNLGRRRLSLKSALKEVDAGRIPARPSKTGDQTETNLHCAVPSDKHALGRNVYPQCAGPG